MRRASVVFFVCAFVVGACLPAAAQYQIKESVIGSGGVSSSGGSFQVSGTVGQPAIGVTSGGSYINQIGFWYQPGWILTGVEEAGIPRQFGLGQNFPNPFNPVTTFRLAVPRAARVRVTLYDVAGRVARELEDREFEPGYHEVPVSAEGLASGVYFCRMSVEDFTETRKLLLLK